jgi:ketosteroid isomerase-like protein
MKPKTLILTLALSLVAAAICSAADTKNIEQALRDLDAEWSKAAAAKDLDKTVSYYADDAIVLPPNAPGATTKEAVRNVWKDTFAITVNGSWKATQVAVDKSGNMGWVSGTFEWTTKDASGKEVNDRGKYLAVFKKQADGKWKCVADMWNSDLPVASASAEQK